MSDSPTATYSQPTRQRLTRKQKHSLVAIGLGNLIEWFDWTIYATFAVYIAASYFNSDNPASALLATLLVFAVGFIARPLGGIVFGWIADTRGRRFALTLAVGMVSAGSLAIAVTPSHESIGVMASIILVAARLVQGLSQGGETPSSQTFLSEIAPPERRGTWATLIYVSGTLGILLTVLAGVVLNAVLTEQQMNSFGWRIPFLVGAVLGLFTLWMRRNMDESEVFEANKSAGRVPIFANIVKYRKEVFTVIGLTVGFTTAYYAWLVNMPTYASTTLGFTRSSTLAASAVGSAVLIIALPVWGRISDRVGRKPVLLVSFGATLVLYLPALALMKQSPVHLALAVAIMSLAIGGVPAIFPAVLAELFPTEVRATGIGLPYALAVALFGGTAPYVQQYIAGLGGVDWFAFYVMTLIVISIVATLTIPETRGKVFE
ncbi:major facilitator transporter (plasmid) [Rhodococcus erythropolis R138]|uniref:MFS transporter n=1 Tax=Rhodococcus erythropolis TaxID=1833 RepID=UPI000492A279|nr:MFS transporter [Rhodococcus erythropolis]ALU73420.1 major facilitator transporter [Rhodococcus erythropolis R138]